MRHYPELRAVTPRDERLQRLFALHHQQTRQTHVAITAPDPLRLPPDVLLTLRARAQHSLKQDEAA